jgi:radical SAM superfamily enzyme YgiQ (UPF0313 family)
MKKRNEILILNLPGLVLKCGSRWYNTTKKGIASLRYYPYPWFMGYAASLLKKNGFNVVFKDAVAMEWTDDETKNFIEKFGPKYLICEPTWVSAKDDKKFLNSLDRSIIKIAVGNYATNYPYECLANGVDFAVVGEYEFPLLDFFQSGARRAPVNFVSNEKKGFELPQLVQNLDIFPFPERDDVPVEYYNEPSCYGRNAVMVSSRGCRLKCDFCNVEAIYGRHGYRVRSAKNVVDEMEYLKNRYEFDEIYFDDDNMICSKEHIVGICKEIIDRKLKIKWLCMGDGLVDDEILGWLARAGCATYKYGLEHLDPDVLKAIPKPYKPNRLLEIIRKCRKLGMKSYVNLMIGLSKSTWEKDLNMIKRVIAANPDLIQLGIATPYPGTVFYKKAKESGWLVSDDIAKFDVTGASSVSYPDYPAEKITEMFKLGWQMWYRHVLFHKPATLWFFFSSEVRRNGLCDTLKKTFAYFLKMLNK